MNHHYHTYTMEDGASVAVPIPSSCLAYAIVPSGHVDERRIDVLLALRRRPELSPLTEQREIMDSMPAYPWTPSTSAATAQASAGPDLLHYAMQRFRKGSCDHFVDPDSGLAPYNPSLGLLEDLSLPLPADAQQLERLSEIAGALSAQSRQQSESMQNAAFSLLGESDPSVSP